jgi:hypothetical protein
VSHTVSHYEYSWASTKFRGRCPRKGLASKVKGCSKLTIQVVPYAGLGIVVLDPFARRAWSSHWFGKNAQPERSSMLRITQSSAPGGGRSVKLEGKLLEPWVEEVRTLFLPATGDSFPRLDLSALSFVDAVGTELLRQLLRQGVAIESCSPFVSALLQLNDTHRSGR